MSLGLRTVGLSGHSQLYAEDASAQVGASALVNVYRSAAHCEGRDSARLDSCHEPDMNFHTGRECQLSIPPKDGIMIE